jgi:hypothetical protein
MSREEVAKELNLSIEKVRKIEEIALRKLRREFLKIDCEENWVDILINHTYPKNCFIKQYLCNFDRGY